MTTEENNDSAEDKRLPWEAPKVELLNIDNTAGGITNIPESSAGFLS